MTRTQGAITQEAMRRAAATVGRASQQLRTTVPTPPVVHPDDTGWRVGGEPAHLMAFETGEATVDQLRSRQRAAEVQEVIPPDYAGVMVTARGRSDDAQAFNDVKQHKCLAHILRAIRAVLQTKKGRARDLGERLQDLWQDAMQLWRALHAGEVADFTRSAPLRWDGITQHLRPRFRTDPAKHRLLNGIGRQQDRGHRRRFWEAPQVEPTNNRAERVLRPAVIARKVSQCSKKQAGAHAVAAFQSVVQTLAKCTGSLFLRVSHARTASRLVMLVKRSG